MLLARVAPDSTVVNTPSGLCRIVGASHLSLGELVKAGILLVVDMWLTSVSTTYPHPTNCVREHLTGRGYAHDYMISRKRTARLPDAPGSLFPKNNL